MSEMLYWVKLIKMTEFEKRKHEIQVYIEFLNKTEEEQSILETALGELEKSKLLRKVLLANTYLLLYNLVESSIRNSIQDIYDHFKQESISFDNLSSSLQELILTNVKGHNPAKLLENITSLATDVVHQSFNQEKIISGNIDAKKIREIASCYGFSTDTEYAECKNGEKLLEIKNKRNDLAHGILSFSDCGKDTSVTDVNNAFVEIYSYIRNITENIQDYINDKKYLLQ